MDGWLRNSSVLFLSSVNCPEFQSAVGGWFRVESGWTEGAVEGEEWDKVYKVLVQDGMRVPLVQSWRGVATQMGGVHETANRIGDMTAGVMDRFQLKMPSNDTVINDEPSSSLDGSPGFPLPSHGGELMNPALYATWMETPLKWRHGDAVSFARACRGFASIMHPDIIENSPSLSMILSPRLPSAVSSPSWQSLPLTFPPLWQSSRPSEGLVRHEAMLDALTATKKDSKGMEINV